MLQEAESPSSFERLLSTYRVVGQEAVAALLEGAMQVTQWLEEHTWRAEGACHCPGGLRGN